MTGKVLFTLIFAGLLASGASHAWRAAAWHNNGVDYYHGAGGFYYGGSALQPTGYHPAVWGVAPVVDDTPVVGTYVATSACQTVQTCNALGNCWLQQSCN